MSFPFASVNGSRKLTSGRPNSGLAIRNPESIHRRPGKPTQPLDKRQLSRSLAVEERKTMCASNSRRTPAGASCTSRSAARR